MNVETELDNKDFFNDIFKTAGTQLKQPDRLSVGLMMVSAAEIKSINAQTRQVDRETDVLSFPTLQLTAGQIVRPDEYPEDVDETTGELYLGDVLICREVAEHQAQEYGHSLDREIGYLFCHAILHLFGYDHMTDEDRLVMRDREEKIMASVGLSREGV